MTAACVAFNDIESRAVSTLALAMHVRRIRDGLLEAVVLTPLVALLINRTSALRNKLRGGVLEKLSDEQLKNLAIRLIDLNFTLRELARTGMIYPVLRIPLHKIQESAEDFDSIVENIYLTLDPSFHRIIESAIEELRLPGVEERATVSHRF
jgi:hypothetical protein